MENYSKIISGNIRYERQRRNLTIEELSDCIGIAPGFLGLIERGQRGTSVRNLCHIAEFFDLTLDQLIRENLLEAKTAHKKKTPREVKEETAMSLLSSLDEEDIEYFITSMKAYIKRKRQLANAAKANDKENKENKEDKE